MDANLIAGVAGGVIGLMGAGVGTFFSIRNADGPRERALMLRLAALGWLWVAALTGWLLLAPRA
jgi:hypothetical protein